MPNLRYLSGNSRNSLTSTSEFTRFFTFSVRILSLPRQATMDFYISNGPGTHSAYLKNKQ